MISAVYSTLLPVDHVLSDLCTWVVLLNNPKYKLFILHILCYLMLCPCCDCSKCVMGVM
jgi:hypothetical protein